MPTIMYNDSAINALLIVSWPSVHIQPGDIYKPVVHISVWLYILGFYYITLQRRKKWGWHYSKLFHTIFTCRYENSDLIFQIKVKQIQSSVWAEFK